MKLPLLDVRMHFSQRDHALEFFFSKLQCGLIFMKNLEFSSLISAHQTSNSLKVDASDPLINSIQIFLANHRPNCLRMDIWSKKKLDSKQVTFKNQKKELGGLGGHDCEEPLNSDLFVLCSFLVDMVALYGTLLQVRQLFQKSSKLNFIILVLSKSMNNL